MLECRRDEKDFLLREDGKYIKQHKESIGNLNAKIEASTLTESEKSKLIEKVGRYSTVFLEVVAATEDVKK